MDFTSIARGLHTLIGKVDSFVDNKSERVVIRATSNEGFIAGMSAHISLGNDEVAVLPLTVENGYGIAEYFVPEGQEYTVSMEAYQGTTPASQTFTASTSRRTVDFTYDCDMAPLGVWIQTTDNLLIAAADWATEGSGKTARGIAVITTERAFLVALTNATAAAGTSVAWGGYGTDVPGCTTTSSWLRAIEDFESEANTTAIIAALNPNWDGSQPTSAKVSAFVDESTVVTTGTNATTGAPAAEAARYYSCADVAAGQWSIPAMGILYLMWLNKAAINAALTACGGTALTNDYNWSSTESSGSNAWFINFSAGTQAYNTKYSGYYLRPVAAFLSR